MTSTTRMHWRFPLALLAISAIPFAAGIARLAGLLGSPQVNAGNARFLAAPFPVVLHIMGASLFSLLGALQFSTGLRLRYPRFHKISGRIVALSGLIAALSGLWMTVVYPIPTGLQGDLLYVVRVLVSTSMLVSIVLAVTAVMRREIGKHRAWMIRGYALGQGAGTQVVVLLPWMLFIGTPSVLQRDVLMTLAWLINLCIGEWAIQRQPEKNFSFI